MHGASIQKIPIHGSQYPEAQSWLGREDTGHPEDPGHSALLDDPQGLHTISDCSLIILKEPA